MTNRITKDNCKRIYERLFHPDGESVIFTLFSKGDQGKSFLSRELAVGCALEEESIKKTLNEDYKYRLKKAKKGVLLIDLDLRKPNQKELNEKLIPCQEASPNLYNLIDTEDSLEKLIISTNHPLYHMILGENSNRFKSYVENHPEFMGKLIEHIEKVARSKKYNPIILDVAGSNNQEIIPFINLAMHKFGVTGAEKLSMTEVANIALNEILYSIRKQINGKIKNGPNEAAKKEITDIINSNNDDLDNLYEDMKTKIKDDKMRDEALGIVKSTVNKAAYGLIFSKVRKISHFLTNYEVLEEGIHHLTSIEGTEEGMKVHNLNGWGWTHFEDLAVRSTNLGASMMLSKHSPKSQLGYDSDPLQREFNRDIKKSDVVNQIEGMSKFMIYNLITDTHEEYNEDRIWQGIYGLKGRDGIEKNIREDRENKTGGEE